MIPIAVGDNVICREIAESNTTAGGIIMPETAMKQLPQKTCVVVSVGELVDADIRAEDTIVCHTQAGQAMLIEGEVCIVLKAPEIYGIINRAPEKSQVEVLQETARFS